MRRWGVALAFVCIAPTSSASANDVTDWPDHEAVALLSFVTTPVNAVKLGNGKPGYVSGTVGVAAGIASLLVAADDEDVDDTAVIFFGSASLACGLGALWYPHALNARGPVRLEPALTGTTGGGWSPGIALFVGF